MIPTTPYYVLLARILKENITTVPVTEINIGDLTSIYAGGQGEEMGINPPEIGDEMNVDDLLRMVENANHNSGRIC